MTLLSNIPLVNGQAYDWASITMRFMGIDVTGVTEIMYKVKQKKDNNYAAGVEPSTRGRGNKEYEASITLEEQEVRRILQAVPRGFSLVDIQPFIITVTYVVGLKSVTDVLMNCEFMDEGVDVKNNDTKIDRKLSLIIAGIQWGR